MTRLGGSRGQGKGENTLRLAFGAREGVVLDMGLAGLFTTNKFHRLVKKKSQKEKKTHLGSRRAATRLEPRAKR